MPPAAAAAVDAAMCRRGVLRPEVRRAASALPLPFHERLHFQCGSKSFLDSPRNLYPFVSIDTMSKPASALPLPLHERLHEWCRSVSRLHCPSRSGAVSRLPHNVDTYILAAPMQWTCVCIVHKWQSKCDSHRADVGHHHCEEQMQYPCHTLRKAPIAVASAVHLCTGAS